jgi:hypothetical protein
MRLPVRDPCATSFVTVTELFCPAAGEGPEHSGMWAQGETEERFSCGDKERQAQVSCPLKRLA